MSRLRNRNIRTKIQAIAKWGNHLATPARNSQKNGKLFENGGTTTTVDSGIAEIVPPAPKLKTLAQNRMRTRTRRSNWNLDSALESDADRERDDSSDEDEESRNSCSSVDTLKVLDEIRNLEDSVKSMSADSYNSWSEEYENDSTQLVKAEFERMERVLQCRESIPSNYDKDEYKLWIKTFPLLSLISRTSSSLDYEKTTSPLFDSLDQISTPKFCDTTPPTPIKNEFLETLNNLENLSLYPTLTPRNQMPTHSSTTTYTNKYLAINNTINPRTVNINADHSFLQLAPLNLTTTHSSTRRQSFKPSHTHTTQKSSTSGKLSDHNRKLILSIEKSNSSSSTRSTVYTSGRTADWLKDVQDFNDFRRFTRNNRRQIEQVQQIKHNQPQAYNFCPPERYEKHPRRKSSKTEPLKSSSEFIVLPPIEGKELRSSSAATISNMGKAPVLPLARLKHPPVYPLYENDKESDHNDGFVSYRHRKRKYK